MRLPSICHKYTPRLNRTTRNHWVEMGKLTGKVHYNVLECSLALPERDHIAGDVGVYPKEREFFIDNLLDRILFIIVTIRWTGLAPLNFEFHFPGSLTSTFLCTPRSKLRWNVRPRMGRKSATLSVGPPLFLYGIGCCRAFGLFTSGLF